MKLNLRYINLKLLNFEETQKLKSLTKEYFKKFKRTLPNSTLIIEINKQKSSGKRVKYSFHIRLEAPSYLLHSKASDWDLSRTLHKVFKNIEREIEHKFKLEGQLQGKIHKK